MKKIFLLLTLFAGIFTACEKEQDMYKVLPIDQVKAPVLAAHDAIEVTAANAKTTTLFSWSAADFGAPTAPEYSLFMKVGATEELITSTFGDSIEILLQDINNVALKAGIPAGVQEAVQIILKASISDSYGVATSAPITLNLTTMVSLPAPIHIIGGVLGSEVWNNANYKYVMFRDNNLAINTYTSYFKAEGFKFIRKDDLGTFNNLYGQEGAGILGNLAGDDIKDITTAGYYTVTADIGQLRYSINPYDATATPAYNNISLIGDFNNWESDLDLVKTDYDPHIWVVDDVDLPAGGLKFRANHDWGMNWGAADQFPYGKGAGGGDNIVIKDEDTGIYFVKFNDLTGHYVFYEK